jgi:hypothetical protein
VAFILLIIKGFCGRSGGLWSGLYQNKIIKLWHIEILILTD